MNFSSQTETVHPLPRSPGSTRTRILPGRVSRSFNPSPFPKFLQSHKQHDQQSTFEMQTKAPGLPRRIWTETSPQGLGGFGEACGELREDQPRPRPVRLLGGGGDVGGGLPLCSPPFPACPPAPGLCQQTARLEKLWALFTSYCRSGLGLFLTSLLAKKTGLFSGTLLTCFLFPRRG